MARLGWGQFRSIMSKASNGRQLVVPPTRPGKSYRVMVYLHSPKDPEANEHGLVEIMSIPSPYFFRYGFQPDDQLAPDGTRVRGYKSFFSALAKRTDRGRKIAKLEVIRRFIAPADYREIKLAARENLMTEGEKSYRKYKHLFRPYENQGDPIGGKRESSTLYSLPAC